MPIDRSRLQLPDDLTEIDQWVLWRAESKNGNLAKVPYSTRLRRASTTNLGDCAEFGTVCDVFRANLERFRHGGLGFVFFSSDPFVGVYPAHRSSRGRSSMADRERKIGKCLVMASPERTWTENGLSFEAPRHRFGRMVRHSYTRRLITQL